MAFRILNNVWLYRVKTKKTKKRKRKKKESKIEAFAKELEANLPKSEQWFRTLYTPLKWDEYNSPQGPFIADVINRRLMYIIEIDGSIHDLPEVKQKDMKKDEYFYLRGFKVFRIKAYSKESYDQIMLEKAKYVDWFFNN